MGWTTFHENRSAKQYFTDYINDCKGLELIDIAIVNFTTAYMAVRDIEKDYTYCLVYLIHRAPKSYHNFGYKDMSEFCGPSNYDCPIRILNKLTPIDKIKELEPDWGDNSFEWAANWRNEILSRNERNLKLKKAIKKGCILKANKSIGFGNGMYSFQYFVKEGRKVFGINNYGERNENKIQVRFSGFKDTEFEVIEK